MSLSLKQKLIGASLSAVVLMAATLTWIAADQLFQQNRAGIYARAESLANATSESIGDGLNSRKQIAQAVIDYTNTPDPITYLQLARESAGFDDIYFGTVDGKMIRSHLDRHRDDYDPRTRPWYQDAKQAGKQIVTPAYRDAITNALLVTVAEPVFRNGAFAGVAGADVLIDNLISSIINMNVGTNAYAMLINRQDKTFLAHPDQSLILQPITQLSDYLDMTRIQEALDLGLIKTTTIHGADKLVYYKNVPNTDWIFGIVMDRETEQAAHSELLRQLIITSIVITLLVIGAVTMLVNYLFRDLTRVSDALAEIATGEGDLTQRLEPRSNDEVGMLAHNFNRFVGNMHSMVSTLNEVSHALSQQAIATASQAEERSTRIQHQQNEINLVATAINQMAAATLEIADNADNTARTAGDTVTVSNHGATQVSQSQQSITGLASEVDSATGVIGELNTHAQSINTILSTIQGIAEQTNLLALNAAIEAARAGEQGRGFAVVADEVRVLSQRTHASTQEIQQMIETLQHTTGRAVGIMEDSRRLAETSVDDANAASASLSQISSAVGNISDMATQIASAAEEQSSVTAEITRNTEGIRDVSNELALEAGEAAKQAANLSQLSHELQQEINRFKL